ncbi:protein of unknown function DUF107 [Thermocrinis albus DSM 14484]|uniref:Uncharacterized protein n=1 Tax=Thermocrinis albus (strain DSM 14484 / JCM 11386 / HI 11/12) TaxID=638303 RepID=D3SPE2_THEAH|nr:nodulation protein NfeD [Thermocrinis albus]ADC89029.1 protein of unknown function DUF107 [Thermocrinis albus DSM 14484]
MRILLILFVLLVQGWGKVLIGQWDDVVSPVMEEYVKRAIREAEEGSFQIFVLKLNTPGGLETSMRKILQEIEKTPVVVVVYVYPPGGRAASAGAIITTFADVAAMAPGTNIGAAHPVQMGGDGEDKTLKEKALQDMLAFVRSMSQKKGRNATVLERMVKESLALTPQEALREGVIDLIASDEKELLRLLDGRTVVKHGRSIQLKTKDTQVVYIEQSFKEKFLMTVTNPTVAYLLLLIGFYGIFFELYNPGTVLPGAVGIISLLLGLYGLGIIGINWLGLLLLLAGIVLLVLELVTPFSGALAVAGSLAVAIGSFILVDPNSPYGRIPISLVVSMAVFTALFFLFIGRLGLQAQKRKKMTGAEELIGEEAEVITDFVKGKGKVMVKGEIWNAVSQEDLRKGDRVKILDVKGLTLYVGYKGEEEP